MVYKSILAVFMLSFINLTGAKMMEDNHQQLNAQEQKIVLISTYTATGDLDKLKVELNAGLDAGLTQNEIKEILIQLYAYIGFPRSLNAINTFMEVINHRVAKGINDPMGEEPHPIPTDRSKYAIGRDNLTKLTGVQPEATPTGFAAFAPGIDVFLKEHLFSDIFERGVLNFKTRELVTIAALSSLKGVEPMLQAHIKMGLNTGLSEVQLNELITLIKANIGKEEAGTAHTVLANVIKTRQSQSK